MGDENYSERTRITTVKLPNGDRFRFRQISEYGFHLCEPIENVYPTAFMTPAEIEQKRQRRGEFVEFLKTVE